MKHVRKRCPTCHRMIRRSTPQNARYWALVHEIAEKVHPQKRSYDAEVWHHFFKSKFLGCDEMTLPNHKTLVIPHSTADLDLAEFDLYMMRVEEWAAERGVYLSDLETA